MSNDENYIYLASKLFDYFTLKSMKKLVLWFGLFLFTTYLKAQHIYPSHAQLTNIN